MPFPKTHTELQYTSHHLEGCQEVDTENLIQHNYASSAYDVARCIRSYHCAVGNKPHNPHNNSSSNKRAEFPLMLVHEKVTWQDLNHANQPVVEPMNE